MDEKTVKIMIVAVTATVVIILNIGRIRDFRDFLLSLYSKDFWSRVSYWTLSRVPLSERRFSRKDILPIITSMLLVVVLLIITYRLLSAVEHVVAFFK